MTNAPDSPIFLKIGGSILDDLESTKALIDAIVDVDTRRPIVLMAGGGRTVKKLKSHQQQLQMDFHGCWHAGIKQIEFQSHVLSAYSSRLELVSTLRDGTHAHNQGSIPIFSPGSFIVEREPFEHSWDITTDSMSVFFAAEFGCGRLLIVTDVDGIYSGSSQCIFEELSLTQLATLPSSKTDPFFPRYLERYPVDVTVLNGLCPDRVQGALRGKQVIGTRVTIHA